MPIASIRLMAIATTALVSTPVLAEGTPPDAAELLDPSYVARSVCGPTVRRGSVALR